MHIGSNPDHRILIFCQTKKGCDALTRSLRLHGWPAKAIHGDKNQQERDGVLAEFKTGQNHIMVATDVAARGLDVKDIKYVINFDFPSCCEDYIHRIGRTGRAGAKGTAYSFFTASANARLSNELIQILESNEQKIPDELRELGNQNKGRPNTNNRYNTSSKFPVSRGKPRGGFAGNSAYGGHQAYNGGNSGYGVPAPVPYPQEAYAGSNQSYGGHPGYSAVPYGVPPPPRTGAYSGPSNYR